METLEEKIISLRGMVKDSNNIVFFGGAGVSTESNIPDFRSSDGLFSKKLNKHFSPEQLVSHTFFVHYPEDFYKFYRENLIYRDAKPNKAHIALADLEKKGKLKAIVTQNIDGLHQMAGSKNVFELHGSVNSNTCLSCGYNMDLEEFLGLDGIVAKCPKCGGAVKPDVVLYEESLNDDTIIGAIRAISQADMLIVGGTSLVVYPAAGFLDYFKGKYIVLINKAETGFDKRADLVINDSIGKVLSSLVDSL
nr:NAD-dependent protein deacylase [uncultured Peptostreptococcus sp.]